MRLLFKWIALTASILTVSYLLDGIHVNSFWSAFFAAAALGILNAVVRPVLLLLTLPINFLTLGIFTFVINALLLLLVSAIVPGFNVDGFWAAVIGAILISIINAILTWGLSDRKNFFFVRRRAVPPADDDTIDLKKNGRGRWE
ncbi:MAG: phage holin family protein [Syntrophobacterales bacterium]|nr:phage holin family protein [Syntrophobacterales bacterium]